MAALKQPRIAVLLPCFNEEAAIARTVAGFRAALPGATVYVYDNNSSDGTIAAARKAGATVRSERQQQIETQNRWGQNERKGDDGRHRFFPA